ncbi:MAG: helix-turn-helix domain-containing protein [Eubacteriales bacterium]|nr:helix-turn-helix domain-containing protein [Eubacteriales bacterium]
METKGGFYISQIKQLQDRIFERLLLENGIEISGGQGRILFVLWKKDNLTISEISEETSLAKNTISVVINGMVNKGDCSKKYQPSKPASNDYIAHRLCEKSAGKI